MGIPDPLQNIISYRMKTSSKEEVDVFDIFFSSDFTKGWHFALVRFDFS